MSYRCPDRTAEVSCPDICMINPMRQGGNTMGWNAWRSEDAETVEQITETVRQMHDEQDAGPLPGTEEQQ